MMLNLSVFQRQRATGAKHFCLEDGHNQSTILVVKLTPKDGLERYAVLGGEKKPGGLKNYTNEDDWIGTFLAAHALCDYTRMFTFNGAELLSSDEVDMRTLIDAFRGTVLMKSKG